MGPPLLPSQCHPRPATHIPTRIGCGGSGGRREDESALQAAPRALILCCFISVYAGVCIRVLNDSAHLPRFWLTNPHTMSFFSTALLTVGVIALVGLVLLLALRPEVRPACTCTDVCKANRIGGYVYQCSVLALLGGRTVGPRGPNPAVGQEERALTAALVAAYVLTAASAWWRATARAKDKTA